MAGKQRRTADMKADLEAWAESDCPVNRAESVSDCSICRNCPEFLDAIRYYMTERHGKLNMSIKSFHRLWLSPKGFPKSYEKLRDHMEWCERELYLKNFKKGSRW